MGRLWWVLLVQVELYTHYTCVQDLILRLQKKLDCRLCSVSLIDSFYCSQPAVFISAVLLVTSTMLRLGLPHVNVLSKVDLLSLYGPLPFNLDFFTELMNLAPLAKYIGAPVDTVSAKVQSSDGDEQDDTSSAPPSAASLTPLQRKLVRMSSALCEVLDDYGLACFLPMNIQDGETVGRVLAAVDKANGFSMASFEATELAKRREENVREGRDADDFSGSLQNVFKLAGRNMESVFDISLDIQERYGQLQQVDEEEGDN
eukprot:gene21425-27455_t